MTECEKYINNGIFSEEFFKEEVICDFVVDTRRKKIWAVEIDMLLQIDRVCKKYGLRYFLVWGSLLGAIRHQGFVPWDDDLDVALPRRDYEELLKHGEEFTFPYFLQTPVSDKGYYYSHAKLRNSNTTALDYPFLFQGFNMGIFVDILPLDYINNDTAEMDFKKIVSLISDNNIAMRLTHPYLNERDKRRVALYKGDDSLRNYFEMNEIAQKTAYSNKVSIMMAVVYGLDRDRWNTECFDELKEVTFNGVTTYVPAGYHDILQITYGDYMIMPPLEKRGNWHNNVYFNPDVPYQKSLEIWEDLYDKDNPNTNQMTQD